MIQELLGGGAGLIGGERKISINGGVLEGTPSPSNSSNTATTTTTTTSSNSENQSLRCPRCDSSNTKFCYYNNYNLTQPRHFCKTCRRYWTKGGALRNVPIGGGCRKNKNASVSTSVGKSSAGKVRTLSSELGKSGLGNGFDHELHQGNQILWATPQNSHLMALLRATQNPNPNNSISNSITVKDEGVLLGSHITSESAVANSGALNPRTLGLDPLSQVPSIGMCSSLWRNNQLQTQHHQQNQQQNGFIMGGVQNSGMQELYQRLRSSGNYLTDHSPVVLSNAATSSSASILESAPVAGGEFGYWNPAYSWSDLPTTNGAYP